VSSKTGYDNTGSTRSQSKGMLTTGGLLTGITAVEDEDGKR
jgi:hypothetical protein